MKIILHGGSADGHEYYVPDQTRHFEIVENMELDWLSYSDVYQRTDQTDEEGRTVFSI